MQQAQKDDMEAERARGLQDIKRLSVDEMRLFSALLSKVDGSVPEDTDVLENAGMSSYSRYTVYDATCSSSDSDGEVVEATGGCGDDDIDDEDDVPLRRKKKSKLKKKYKKKLKRKKSKIEDKEAEGSGSMFAGDSTVGVTGDGRSIRDL